MARRPFFLAKQPVPTGAPLRNREPATAPAPWTSLVDDDLQIVAGSALDLTARIPTAVPAGARGRVRAIAADPTQLEESGNPGVPVRFNIATWMAVDPVDRASCTAGIEYLRRCGYNAIRLHGVENWLMAFTTGAYAFIPERLDMFRWLMAECKRVGLYWIINPASYRLYEDGQGGTRETWTDENNTKPRIYTEQGVRDNWKEGFRRLYIEPNPYTGIGAALDPACVHIELYNESGPTFVASKIFPPRWLARSAGAVPAAQLWNEWLADPTKAHGYANIAAANASWGTAYANFAAVPAPPVWLSGSYPNTQFAIDGVLYGTYLEDHIDAFYTGCMTEWGVQALTSFHQLYPQVLVSRAVGRLASNQMANTHGYPLLEGSLTPGLNLGGASNTPVWDTSKRSWLFAHPFVCSNKPRWYGEYGWSVWGRYRAQFALQAAMASMQGACGISQYAQGNFFRQRYENLTNQQGGFFTRQVWPYWGQSDPVHDFNRALVSLVFLQGARNAYSQSLILNDRYCGTSPRNTGRIGRAMSYLLRPLSYLSGFARTSLDYTTDTTDDTLAATWNTKTFKQLLDDMVTAGSITTGNATYIDVTANQGAISACDITTDPQNPRFTVASHTLTTGDEVQIPNLTGSGANWPGVNGRNGTYACTVISPTVFSLPINASTWTGTFSAGTWCAGLNVYESPDASWGISSRTQTGWINTGRISYLSHIGSTLPRTLGSVIVTQLDDHCSVFVASLDGQAINASARLLIGMSADAQNTGMTFTDGNRTELVTAGDYPVQATDATAALTLTLTRPTEWKLYRLQRNGVRNSQETPVSANNAAGQLLLKLRTGTVQPAVMWELVRG